MLGQDFDAASIFSKSSISSTKAACLECRSKKVTCKIGESARACQRCEKFGLQCRFEIMKKRGRKRRGQIHPISPKAIEKRHESVNHTESSPLPRFSSSFRNKKKPEEGVDDEVTRSHDLLSKSFRSRLWQILMQYQIETGQSFIPMTFGEVDKTSSAQTFSNLNQSIESPEDFTSSKFGQLTLRQILRPLNGKLPETNRIVADLPLIVRFDIYPDPRVIGVVSPARCEELLQYYDSNLLPWIGAVTSAQDLSLPGTRWSSTFLLSTVLYIASRFSNLNANSQEEQALGMHARSLATRAFGCADKSLETLAALHLLTVWKAPDDAYSHSYAGYAEHIASISRTSVSNDKLSEKDAKNALRIQLFHYIQRNTFQLFYVPSINEIMDQDGFALPFPTSSRSSPPLLALERFAAGNSTLLSDWQLCATVEGRSVCCKHICSRSDMHILPFVFSSLCLLFGTSL